MKVFFTLLFVWLLGSTALWGQPADMVWNSLNEENKVSLFVRFIDIETGGYETTCRYGMEQPKPEFIRLHALRRWRYRHECVGRGR